MQKERELKTSFVYIKIEETEFWARNAKKKTRKVFGSSWIYYFFIEKKNCQAREK